MQKASHNTRSGGLKSAPSYYCTKCTSGGGDSHDGPNKERVFSIEGSAHNGPSPLQDMSTRNLSVVEEFHGNYYHCADDIPASRPNGVQLRRIQRARNLAQAGSFGRGSFCNYDIRLTISRVFHLHPSVSLISLAKL